MKKFWSILVVLIVISGTTLGLIYFRSHQYDIIQPKHGEITEAVYGLGKVKSHKRFEVVIGVISTVTKRFVNEGALVEKGAPLIEFDSQSLFRAPFRGAVTFVNLYQGETAIPHVPILRIEDLNDRYIELSLEQQAILRIKPGLPAKISF